jgi:hypothetical protein
VISWVGGLIGSVVGLGMFCNPIPIPFLIIILRIALA